MCDVPLLMAVALGWLGPAVLMAFGRLAPGELNSAGGTRGRKES